MMEWFVLTFWIPNLVEAFKIVLRFENVHEISSGMEGTGTKDLA
jgi:hypothetical protein